MNKLFIFFAAAVFWGSLTITCFAQSGILSIGGSHSGSTGSMSAGGSVSGSTGSMSTGGSVSGSAGSMGIRNSGTQRERSSSDIDRSDRSGATFFDFSADPGEPDADRTRKSGNFKIERLEGSSSHSAGIDASAVQGEIISIDRGRSEISVRDSQSGRLLTYPVSDKDLFERLNKGNTVRISSGADAGLDINK